MIIVMSPTSTKENLEKVEQKITRAGLKYHLSEGDERTIVGVIGDKKIIAGLQMNSLDGVEKTVRITEKYKHRHRRRGREDRRGALDGHGGTVRCREHGAAHGSG